MGYIEWTSSLSVGFAEIDQQHRGLVDRINSLAAAMNENRDRAALGGILDDLRAYAASHFVLEEGYFDLFKYREAEVHKKEHAAFASKVNTFSGDFSSGKAEVSAELLAFLRGWLTNHIAFSDRKYRSSFAQHGLK